MGLEDIAENETFLTSVINNPEKNLKKCTRAQLEVLIEIIINIEHVILDKSVLAGTEPLTKYFTDRQQLDPDDVRQHFIKNQKILIPVIATFLEHVLFESFLICCLDEAIPSD